MGHPPQPQSGPDEAPLRPALDAAYRRGFLDGHLAGWQDAVARAVATGPLVPLPGTTPVSATLPVRSAAPSPSSVRVGTAAPIKSAAGAPSSAPGAGQNPLTARPAVPPAPNRPPITPWLWSEPSPPRPSRPPVRAAVPLPGRPGPNPRAVAARKAKRENQNINITLYIASLLMVAAAALFVASSLPAGARLVGVWAGTALFYAAGLVLHRRVPRLRAAAVAFLGTALAIIPFAGLATYNLGFQYAAGVWFVTSLVGAAAYLVAAVRLHSRLVVYLSMAFLLSTAWSSVAIMGAALAWYFTALIVFSALFYLAGHLLRKRGSGHDSDVELYAKPVGALGPWFAPVGIAGSLAFSLALNAADHALVLLAGAVYYAVMVGLDTPGRRLWNYVGLRFSLTAAAPFLGWLMGESLSSVAAGLAVVLGLQAVAVAHVQTRLGPWLGRPRWPRIDVYGSIPAVAAVCAVWSLAIAVHDSGVWSPALPLALALLVAMAALPPFLPAGEWFPLPALSAAVLCSPVLTAREWMVLQVVAVAYALVRFALSKAVVVRRIMVVAARVLLTALAATALVAYVPAQDGKVELILSAVAVMAAGQLLADTALPALRGSNPVIAWSGTAWAVLGTALVVVLAFDHALVRDTAAQGALVRSELTQSLTVSALPDLISLGATVAASAMACAAIIHSSVNLRRNGSPRAAELMAPIVLIVVAFSVGEVHGAVGAVVAWAAVVVFLVAMGAALRGDSLPAHRWLYWRGARLASLFLAGGLFAWWTTSTGMKLAGGAPVTGGLVLLLALAVHLCILAGARWRQRGDRWLAADEAATLLLAVVAAAADVVMARLSEWGTGGWFTMLAVGISVAAVALLGLAAALPLGQPPPVAANPEVGAKTTAWLALAVMAVMAALRAGDRPILQVALAVVLLATAAGAVKGSGRRLRSAHFLVARASVTALLGSLVAQTLHSPTAFTLIMCAVLVLQLVVHWLVQRRTAQPVVGEPGVLSLSLWILLAAQAVLPLTYVLDAGGFGASGGARREVVVLELAVLAGSSIAAQWVLRQRAASFLAIFAVVGAAAVVTPVAWPGATALVLAGLSVAAIVWRCAQEPKTVEMRWYWLVAVATFLCSAIVLDHDAGPGIFAAVWLVTGTALIAGAHLQRIPWLTLPGSLMVLVAAALVRSWVLEAAQQPGFAALAGFAALLGTLFLVRLVLSDLDRVTSVQLWSVRAPALGGGLAFALMALAHHDAVLPGAAAVTAVLAIACIEAPAKWRGITIDVAVVAAALAWFWATSVYLPLGAFWLVQWLAVALGALALMRFKFGKRRAGSSLMMAAASLASVGGLMTFFSGDALQQLVSLLLFVGLLMAGLGVDKRMFTVWGAIGVATAVVWYLRGYSFVLLALLALALIGLAIWRLNRKYPHDAAPGVPNPPRSVPVYQSQTPDQGTAQGIGQGKAQGTGEHP